MTSVAIFGGGVAGLSAAHELAKFSGDFEITVYEPEAHLGGKAGSQTSGDPSTAGTRRELLGEHGFRFFPGFYRYVTAAMAEIAHPDGGTVLDQLVESDATGIAYPGEALIVLPRRPSRSYAFDLYQMLVDMTGNDEIMRFPSADLARAALKRLKFITSCAERREADYEGRTWLDFIEEAKLSDGYKGFEAALNRTLSAMGPEDTNAKVVGEIGMQFILGALRPSERKDALLNAPTRYAWLDPWKAHLDPHVTFLTETLKSFSAVTVGGVTTVTGALLESGETIVADVYLCALPLDRAKKVMPTEVVTNFPIPAFDPATSIEPLQEWMVGAQIYLKTDIPLCRGHFFLPDSPWALSGVSQGQFWRRERPTGGWDELADLYGEGDIKGVLSIAISEWKTPDHHPTDPRAAKDCDSRQDVLDRMLAQLIEGMNGAITLADVHSMHLDENLIEAPVAFGVPRFINNSPLLVHPPRSQQLRPNAFSDKVPNLLLASDYVRTFTQLATMEGANEAARAAVIRLLSLKALRYEGPVPAPLFEEPIFDFAKDLDRRRFLAGESHLLDSWPFRDFGDGALGFELIDTAMKLLGLISSALP